MMKHIKNFESFDGPINEELFGFSKLEKAIKKFKDSNKELFKSLKEAEKDLNSKDEESKNKLKSIQDELVSKLNTFSKSGGELFSILAIKKIDSDYTTAVREIRDEILNIDPFDNRSVMQRMASGSSAGRSK